MPNPVSVGAPITSYPSPVVSQPYMCSNGLDSTVGIEESSITLPPLVDPSSSATSTSTTAGTALGMSGADMNAVEAFFENPIFLENPNFFESLSATWANGDWMEGWPEI